MPDFAEIVPDMGRWKHWRRGDQRRRIRV